MRHQGLTKKVERKRETEVPNRVTFNVIKRRARLGRRVTRPTTRLPLPTRVCNMSDRALDSTETGYFARRCAMTSPGRRSVMDVVESRTPLHRGLYQRNRALKMLLFRVIPLR